MFQRLVVVGLVCSSVLACHADEYSLGITGIPITESELEAINTRMKTRYRDGLRITDIKVDSLASAQKLKRGDVLLGVGGWQTGSQKELAAIMTRLQHDGVDRAKFYIVRDQHTLFGWFAFRSPAGQPEDLTPLKTNRSKSPAKPKVILCK